MSDIHGLCLQGSDPSVEVVCGSYHWCRTPGTDPAGFEGENTNIICFIQDVCYSMYADLWGNICTLSLSVGVKPHPLLIFWASVNTLDASVLPLQPLSPTEVLFLPIMQLSYKHSVFSFVHLPVLLSWPAVGLLV